MPSDAKANALAITCAANGHYVDEHTGWNGFSTKNKSFKTCLLIRTVSNS